MDKVKQGLKDLKRIFFKEQTQIISAALSLIFIRLLTKASGMIYTIMMSSTFGAGKETDIFNAANAIPEMITTVILVGAISGSIIPVLIKVKEKESKEIFINFFNSILNSGLLIFLFLTLIIMIFAGDAVSMASQYGLIDTSPNEGGFRPEELDRIANLMRVLMIPQALLGISAFQSSILNVYERFIIPSLAPLFYNIGRILGLVIFALGFDMGADALAYGTVIGSIAHFMIHLPLMRHLGVRYVFKIDLSIKYFKDVLLLGLPRVLSLAAEQVVITVNRILALALKEGSISAYNYGLSLIAIPLSLFGTSFAVASFPSLSKYYEKGKYEEFSALFRKVINQVLFLTIPVAAAFIVLRLPLTRLFYGLLGGQFSWEDTRQVAWVILFVSIGLPFESLRALIYRVYYSMHDSVKPLIVSFTMMIIGIICTIGFTNYFSHYNGFDIGQIITSFEFNKEHFNYFFERQDGDNALGGLALSTAIVFTFEFFLLMFLLRTKNVIKNLKDIFIDIIKRVGVGLILIVATYLMFKSWDDILQTTRTINLIILTFTTLFAVSSFYLWLSYLLGISEVDMILDFMQKYWYKAEKRFPFLGYIRNIL